MGVNKALLFHVNVLSGVLILLDISLHFPFGSNGLKGFLGFLLSFVFVKLRKAISLLSHQRLFGLMQNNVFKDTLNSK